MRHHRPWPRSCSQALVASSGQGEGDSSASLGEGGGAVKPPRNEVHDGIVVKIMEESQRRDEKMEKKMGAGLGKIETQLKEFRGEIEAEFKEFRGEVKAEFKELRAEVKASQEKTDSSIKGLRELGVGIVVLLFSTSRGRALSWLTLLTLIKSLRS